MSHKETVVGPVLIGHGLGFAEGINFDRGGTLYCVDLLGGGVWRLPPGGTLQEWVRTGGPNGSRFGPGGDLFIAEYQRRAILRLSIATGEETIYAGSCDSQPFQGPNDLCFGPDGVMYFTDPGESSLTNRIGAVYAVAPAGRVTCIVHGLSFPNGIVVTPDGTTLVVADTFTGLLRRYSLDPLRHYEELEPLATLNPAGDGENEAGPDGMVYGADGNLYVAHYNSGMIRVINPSGTIIGSLPCGGPTPTNVAFWQQSLYVAEGATGSLYRLDIGVGEHPPFMRPW